LRYRKFDTTYMRLFQGEQFRGNDLPVVTLASDRIVFPVGRKKTTITAPNIPVWERWNDYGIGMLRKPDRGALRQAETAFRHVTDLGRADGDINLARVMIREGRLEEAGAALRSAANLGAYPWLVAWFGGLVDLQNGELDAAISGFKGLSQTRFAEARRRGFDFSLDYRLQNTLAQALFERAKLSATSKEAANWLREAVDHFETALEIDPENLTAHYGLAQVHARLGDEERARAHRALHEKYRPDDNANDRAVAIARRGDEAANYASEAIVIYDLQRSTPRGLTGEP